MFIRYPHLIKYGGRGTEGIEYGITHIFPKLDGTNSSVWFEQHCEGEHGTSVILACGSRNRELSPEKDNAGFCKWVDEQSSYDHEDDKPLAQYLEANKTHILYGEWLVPHTIKNYREEAWRKFWIFDVYDKTTQKFLPYEVYQPMLEAHQLNYIPCIKKFKNGNQEQFLYEAQKHAGFMLPEGQVGEGVVIKNYDWSNANESPTWAKIVLAEFKDKFHAAMGANLEENVSNATRICDIACTPSLIEKEYAKILVANDNSWSNKFIPRLLSTTFHSVVVEELWDCLKVIKHGQVDFKELQNLIIQKIKETKPELFQRDV